MGRRSSGSGFEVITLVVAMLGAKGIEAGLAGAELVVLLYSVPMGIEGGTLDGLDLFLFGI